MISRVLITGARAAAALDLARDFVAAGWEAHLADCSGARMAKASRETKGVHRYASPVREPARFRRDIAAMVDRLDPALVVPVCEEVFHLAAPSRSPVLGDKLFAPRFATLRQLHDKLAFAELCESAGLAVPESRFIQTIEESQALRMESSEWVFKPRFSRFGESACVGPSARDLSNLPVPILAQRRVRGEEVCFYAIAHGGVLTAFCAYRSRWRLGGGASFAFEPIEAPCHDALHELADRLASVTALTGQFACDAIMDGDGKPWLIECNPRATSGVHMLAGSGDLARAIADGVAMPAMRPTPHHVAPAMLVFGLPMALREGRLGEWRETMREGRDAIARPGDRRPFFGAMLDGARFAISGLRHGISTTAATTRDIEWNGEDLP
ncbi:MAG: ATP-grasp domain-containing protein [Alteraurantiacibacter sp.]